MVSGNKSSKLSSKISGKALAVWALSAAIVLCLGVATGRAQVSASISGSIHDASGAVVTGATVAVRNLETGAVRTVTSNDVGAFQVSALPVGRYEIKAEMSGFKTAVRTGVDLVVGQEATINLNLEVGEAMQEVTVSAEAPLVNATTSSISGLVGEKAVKDLPLNGRSFDNLITLNPGTALIQNTATNAVSSGTSSGQGNLFAVSGNRGDFNIFLLNGIEYTGVSSTLMVPAGPSHQLLGVDAIREFNVLTNTYSAEYGKRPGGQITAITMSGTNGFHGSAFEFLRNSFFDARNFFDRGSVPAFKRNQFGGSAGGPIKRDKTFIFGNYEGFRQRLANTTVGVVPDDNARLGLIRAADGSLQNVGIAPGIAPYFQLWHRQNGPEIANGIGGAANAFSITQNSIQEDFGTVRVDHTFSLDDSFSSVYTIDDGYNRLFDQPVLQFSTVLRTQILSLQETHIFSPSVLTTLRAGFSRATWDFDTAPPITDANLSFVEGKPIGSISIGGNFGGGSTFSSAGAVGTGQRTLDARSLFTFTGDTQITHGAHQLSMGVWFQRLRSNENAAPTQDGTAIFGSLTSFLQGQASSVTAGLNPAEIGWRQFLGAWYVQDSIKVKPNLSIAVGLRHEFNNGWNSPQGMASNFVFGPNGILNTQPVVGNNLYTDNHAKLLFGPRVGVVWTPFGEGKTSVRAAAGIYYNMMDNIGAAVDGNTILLPGSTVPLNNMVSITNPKFPLLLSPKALLPGALPNPNGVQSDFLTPTVQQWSFKIEQGITPNLMVSAGYVGEHGIHLPLSSDLNAAIPQVLSDGSLFVPPGSTRANPRLSNSRYVLMEDNSSYNALQLDVTRRFSKGLQFRGNYTWSKSLDFLSSTIFGGGGGPGGSGSLSLLVPRNPRLNWGPSNFDLRQRLSAHFSYDIPVGHGKALLGSASGILDKMVGGWQLNSIVTVQTAFYFTPLVGFNRSGNGDSRNPDRVSINPNFTGSAIRGVPTQWFNPAAFLLPSAGTIGNVSKNSLPGPALRTVDLSLFKTTKIAERSTLQFRAEAFNLFNHVNFSEPSANVFTSSGGLSPAAGLITSTYTTSRQLQLALKLVW